jgi:rhodanese-related sulfurtransferase
MEMTIENAKAFKEELFQQFGSLGGALSSPNRLELLDILCQGEHTVEDLARQTGLSISNVSQHLRVMKNARLVESKKQGLYVHYSVADPAVIAFWGAFRSLAVSRLADVREVIRLHLDDQDQLEPIEHDELRERMKNGDLVLLDVRPEDEFQAGHIPGAVSIPLTELEQRLNEIPKDREVVAFCRGVYCVMALESVKLLREKGYRARRYEDGIPEWQARGNPVEKE